MHSWNRGQLNFAWNYFNYAQPFDSNFNLYDCVLQNLLALVDKHELEEFQLSIALTKIYLQQAKDLNQILQRLCKKGKLRVFKLSLYKLYSQQESVID